jgi:neutral ceramidase
MKSINLRIASCLVVATLVGRTASAEDRPREFRAGAATSNITPWLGVSINGGMSDRKATHVHDELHARCIVLDDGNSRLAFAVCDMCMIPRDVMDRAKEIVQHETGIAPDRVLISATHTHEAPTAAGVFQSDPDPAYPPFLARRIADGIRRAVNNLVPAKIGWGVGSEPTQVFNRRWFMKPGFKLEDPFGLGTDKVKMNPPAGSDMLDRPAGPIDPDLSIVSIQSKSGQPIAVLANYSLHYVGDSGPGAISADYFALFADRLQQRIGADRLDPPFVGIMSNGTSGNINNVNFRTPREPKPTYGHMTAVAERLADEAHRVYQSIAYRDSITLAAQTEHLKLGVRKPTRAEVENATRLVAQAKDAHGELRGLGEVYARETVLLAEYPNEVDCIIQAFAIGELAVCAIPCEVFVEIGQELKQKSPFKPTFTISLANGYNGYLPTPEHHALGGYETWRARSSYLEVDASTKIVATVLRLLQALNR